MNFNTIIVDDEPLARRRIEELLNEDSDFNIVQQCSSGLEAIKAIEINRPQVVFLDIHLKDMDGISILDQLSIYPLPYFVFVTAYDKYAIEAFNRHAIDYILKPFKNDRFFDSLSLIKERYSKNYDQKLNELTQFFEYKTKFNSKMLLTQNNKTLFFDSNKIKYITASGYYAEIFTEEDKKYVVRESLKNLIRKLNPTLFYRIHRSTIINIDYAIEILHSGYNETDIRMTDQKVFRVSKSYKADFIETLNSIG